MEYSFSWGTFMLGLLIMVAGAVLTLFYQKVADALGGGMADYEKYKLAGVIACAVGMLVAFNVVNLLLTFLVSMLFHIPTQS